MSEHKPLYVCSLSQAVRSNEGDLWRESYKENCDCARAIEKAINENYHDNRLDDCVKPIIEQYGFNRVTKRTADFQRKTRNGQKIFIFPLKMLIGISALNHTPD